MIPRFSRRLWQSGDDNSNHRYYLRPEELHGRQNQTAAVHPAASRRGMRGAAAWKRYYIDLTYSLVEHVCTLSPMQASGYCHKIKHEWSIGPRTISFSEVLGSHQMEGGLPFIPIFWNIWDMEVYTTCKHPFLFSICLKPHDIIIRMLSGSNPIYVALQVLHYRKSIAVRLIDR